MFFFGRRRSSSNKYRGRQQAPKTEELLPRRVPNPFPGGQALPPRRPDGDKLASAKPASGILAREGLRLHYFNGEIIYVSTAETPSQATPERPSNSVWQVAPVAGPDGGAARRGAVAGRDGGARRGADVRTDTVRGSDASSRGKGNGASGRVWPSERPSKKR